MSLQDTIARLQAHLAKGEDIITSEFKVGDIVRLDTGAIGIVNHVDPMEGTAYVYYEEEITEELMPPEYEIKGPSFGFELTKLTAEELAS